VIGVNDEYIRQSLHESVLYFTVLLLGLLRPLVFYNRLAVGQKDRLTGQP